MSWYKVERGWLDNPFFQDLPYSERDAWQWMIGEAAFEECRISVGGKPFTLGKGQLYSSIRFMAQKFQWSNDRVMRFLNRLSEWGMVSTDTSTGQNLITICNYCKYQDRQSEASTAPLTPVRTPVSTAAEHQQVQTISPSRNSSPSRQELYAASFERFWAAYPKTRAGARHKAFKAYLEAVERSPAEQIHDGCVRYAASEEVSKGYGKGCAAWLNDDRWLNDYSPPKETRKLSAFEENVEAARSMMGGNR